MALELGVFPSESVLVGEFFKLFENSKSQMAIVFPTLLSIRALMTLISMKEAREYGIVFRDLIIGIVLLVSFKEVASLILKVPSYLREVFYVPSRFDNADKFDLYSILNNAFPSAKFVLESFPMLVFYLTLIVYFLAFGFLITISAYAISVGMMLEQYWMLTVLFGGMGFVISLPMIWYIVNFVIYKLSMIGGLDGFLIYFTGAIIKTVLPMNALIKLTSSLVGPTFNLGKKAVGKASAISASSVAAGERKLQREQMLEKVSRDLERQTYLRSNEQRQIEKQSFLKNQEQRNLEKHNQNTERHQAWKSEQTQKQTQRDTKDTEVQNRFARKSNSGQSVSSAIRSSVASKQMELKEQVGSQIAPKFSESKIVQAPRSAPLIKQIQPISRDRGVSSSPIVNPNFEQREVGGIS